MTIQYRANQWIAGSGDDTEELQAAAEIMVGLMAELKDRNLISQHRFEMITKLDTEISALTDELVLTNENEHKLKEENAALKLQLSGRTYCHSDEAVESELKAIRAICGELPDKPSAATTVQLVENLAVNLINTRVSALEEASRLIQGLITRNGKNTPHNRALRQAMSTIRGHSRDMQP
jgi:hypothetical protein